MTSKSSRWVSFVAASAVAILLAANSGSALAGHHGNSDTNSNGGSTTSKPPLHGPGSSHNPIVYHPVHGPGSSHNPIVKTGSSTKNCMARGTVVRDHRNGKDCSYVAGDSRSYNRYLRCEGIHHGGATPWC